MHFFFNFKGKEIVVLFPVKERYMHGLKKHPNVQGRGNSYLTLPGGSSEAYFWQFYNSI